jgi:hypothetical protein
VDRDTDQNQRPITRLLFFFKISLLVFESVVEGGPCYVTAAAMIGQLLASRTDFFISFSEFPYYVFFTKKYIKIIFFYFLKIIFEINLKIFNQKKINFFKKTSWPTFPNVIVNLCFCGRFYEFLNFL